MTQLKLGLNATQPNTSSLLLPGRLILSDVAKDKGEIRNPLANSGRLLSVVEVKGQSPRGCEPDERGEGDVGVRNEKCSRCPLITTVGSFITGTLHFSSVAKHSKVDQWS